MAGGSYISMGEAHRRITDYLNRFSDAVSYQDGASLKSLLSLSSNPPLLLSLADALNIFQEESTNKLIKQAHNNNNNNNFPDIVTPLFRSFQNYRIAHFVDSYLAFEKAAKYVSLAFLIFWGSLILCVLILCVYVCIFFVGAVLLFRSLGTGNQLGLWRLCLLLFMKLGFLLRG